MVSKRGKARAESDARYQRRRLVNESLIETAKRRLRELREGALEGGADAALEGPWQERVPPEGEDSG